MIRFHWCRHLSLRPNHCKRRSSNVPVFLSGSFSTKPPIVPSLGRVGGMEGRRVEGRVGGREGGREEGRSVIREINSGPLISEHLSALC